MRINEQQIVSDLLYSLGQDNSSINKLQEQISTGQIVNSPSDNPALNQQLMLLQGQVNQNNVYTQNAQYAYGFLNEQSSVLNSAVGILTNIKTMMVSAANDTNAHDLQSYGTELGQQIKQLLDLSNTQYGGKYIFGGTETTSQPFFMNAAQTAVSANPNGVGGALQLNVGQQMTEQYNITDAEDSNNGNLFNDLISIENSMASGNTPSQANLSTVSNYLNSMINTNAKAGAMMDRFNLIQNQLSSQNQTLQTTISNLGNTDVASAVIQLQQQQTTLNAALKTGSGIIQLSLANYL
jgi:flagellar hook-associated protein 3 FlgL